MAGSSIITAGAPFQKDELKNEDGQPLTSLLVIILYIVVMNLVTIYKIISFQTGSLRTASQFGFSHQPFGAGISWENWRNEYEEQQK